MPAGSRPDCLPLAKAKPIRSNSNTSAITYLRTEECLQKKIQPGKSGVRIWNDNADTKVSAEGEGGGTPWEQGKDIELRPLQPMGDHRGAETPLQPMEEPTLEQVEAGRRL
ncbi:protein pxr1-like [Pitangus sulphuratus]|nr:protein pxr1-like [Pitangus sulphuratus]